MRAEGQGCLLNTSSNKLWYSPSDSSVHINPEIQVCLFSQSKHTPAFKINQTGFCLALYRGNYTKEMSICTLNRSKSHVGCRRINQWTPHLAHLDSQSLKGESNYHATKKVLYRKKLLKTVHCEIDPEGCFCQPLCHWIKDSVCYIP